MRKRLECSFCGKSQDKVEKLIATDNVCICNYCIELCNNILFEEKIKKIVREMIK